MKQVSSTVLTFILLGGAVLAQQPEIVKNDFQIDALDPGIKIFMREKIAQGNAQFNNDNVVLFRASAEVSAIA